MSAGTKGHRHQESHTPRPHAQGNHHKENKTPWSVEDVVRGEDRTPRLSGYGATGNHRITGKLARPLRQLNKTHILVELVALCQLNKIFSFVGAPGLSGQGECISWDAAAIGNHHASGLDADAHSVG